MFKYAVLAIAIINAALISREEAHVEITKRFLAGAATAENFGDIAQCIKALEDLLAKGETLKTDCIATVDLTRLEKMIASIHPMKSLSIDSAENLADFEQCLEVLAVIITSATAIIANLE